MKFPRFIVTTARIKNAIWLYGRVVIVLQGRYKYNINRVLVKPFKQHHITFHWFHVE